MKYNANIYSLKKQKTQNKLQRAWLVLLLSQRFDYFITLNFFAPKSDPFGFLGSEAAEQNLALLDGPITYAVGRNSLKHWQAKVDSSFLGRSWSKASVEERLFFIAVPERGRASKRYDNNLHYHLLARVPYPHGQFENSARRFWGKLWKSGDAYCQLIGSSPEDQFRARNYVTKRLSVDDGYSNIIISTEFQTN